MIIGTVSSQLLMKSASNKVEFYGDIKLVFNSFLNLPLIFGILIIIPVPFFYNLSLDYFSLSYAFSFTGLNYVFVAILSKIFFRERLQGKKIIGILLIVIGIFLYNPIFQ